MTAGAEENGKKGGALKMVGGCVSALGCLISLMGLAILGAVVANVFNYSVEPGAMVGGSGALCCGLMVLILGVGVRLGGGWVQLD